ncbi:oxidoreductase [Sulfolobales archaeon HS-7]|nr:oxidoreductase [Sulfolobales archaeon HS-7]
MLALLVFIASVLLGALIFFINDKKLSGVISLLSIAINLLIILEYGELENYFLGSYIGNFGFVVNDLNLPFIITIVLVTAASSIYASRYMEERFKELEIKPKWNAYYGLFTVFAISMIYVTTSTNLVELYVFLEVSLVSSFLLILLYGYGNRRRISLMYFIWTHIGTILLLASILTLIFAGPYKNPDIYQRPFQIVQYTTNPILTIAFVLAIIGMMIKAAMFLFNTWLPYAHGEAPTPISVLLSPNTVGLGVFVIILYYFMFPQLNLLAPVFIIWALVTMIYGGIMAFTQGDFKRFLAYSSVSQMGYMMLAASIGFALGLSQNIAILPLAIVASILIYVSHGLGKAILFMSAGASITEIGTRDIERLGGLYLSSPLHSTTSFIGILNLLGLPPTIGLISEILLILSAGELGVRFGEAWFIGIVAAIMIAIGTSSAYLTYLFKRVYGGKKESVSLDKIIAYSIPMLFLAVMSIIFFFVPNLLSPAFNYLVNTVPANSVLPLLVFILPLIASIIALITPKGLNQDIRGYLGFVLNIIAFVISLNMVYQTAFLGRTLTSTLFYLTFQVSPLQAVLASIVSGLASFISLYSVGYMKEDSVLRRYWGFFEFFVASMLSVVIAGNLYLFLIGWEGTSLASYGLISYYLDDNPKNIVGKPEKRVLGIPYISTPTNSGIRAMIFTRLADVGLIAGFGSLLIFSNNTLLYNSQGLLTVGLRELFINPLTHSYWWVIALILFLGGLSKSAQFPFTQWLLTAMTGPTPVSALIHAATMVNLGAFITFLFYPFFIPALGTPELNTFAEVMIGISLFTIFYTSFGALASDEQKVLLAYSTADQISFMILSSSVGLLIASFFGDPTYLYIGILAGVVQFLAHGLYKASLFMNAGSVIHATESRFIGTFKNLYNKIKTVFVLQLIAALNLADIPFLIGYWGHQGVAALANYVSGLFPLIVIAEFLGSIYIMRLVFKTFTWSKGEEIEESHHLHPTMIIAPAILVLTSIGLGVGFYTVLSSLFTKVISLPYSEIASYYYLDPIVIIAVVIGILISLIYTRGIEIGNKLQTLSTALEQGFYLNPVFDRLGYGYHNFSSGLFNSLERRGFDETFNERIPQTAYGLGRAWSRIQDGIIGNYVAVYAIGLIIIFLLLIIFTVVI